MYHQNRFEPKKDITTKEMSPWYTSLFNKEQVCGACIQLLLPFSQASSEEGK
jgi:hypothetical protein